MNGNKKPRSKRSKNEKESGRVLKKLVKKLGVRLKYCHLRTEEKIILFLKRGRKNLNN
jgi:hypothetical protein